MAVAHLAGLVGQPRPEAQSGRDAGSHQSCGPVSSNASSVSRASAAWYNERSDAGSHQSSSPESTAASFTPHVSPELGEKLLRCTAQCGDKSLTEAVMPVLHAVCDLQSRHLLLQHEVDALRRDKLDFGGLQREIEKLRASPPPEVASAPYAASAAPEEQHASHEAGITRKVLDMGLGLKDVVHEVRAELQREVCKIWEAIDVINSQSLATLKGSVTACEKRLAEADQAICASRQELAARVFEMRERLQLHEAEEQVKVYEIWATIDAEHQNRQAGQKELADGINQCVFRMEKEVERLKCSESVEGAANVVGAEAGAAAAASRHVEFDPDVESASEPTSVGNISHRADSVELEKMSPTMLRHPARPEVARSSLPVRAPSAVESAPTSLSLVSPAPSVTRAVATNSMAAPGLRSSSLSPLRSGGSTACTVQSQGLSRPGSANAPAAVGHEKAPAPLMQVRSRGFQTPSGGGPRRSLSPAKARCFSAAVPPASVGLPEQPPSTTPKPPPLARPLQTTLHRGCPSSGTPQRQSFAGPRLALTSSARPSSSPQGSPPPRSASALDGLQPVPSPAQMGVMGIRRSLSAMGVAGVGSSGFALGSGGASPPLGLEAPALGLLAVPNTSPPPCTAAPAPPEISSPEAAGPRPSRGSRT